MIKKFTFFLLIGIVLTGCSSNEKNNTPSQPVAATKTPEQTQSGLPSITMEILQDLWDNCNQVDYIYYELPISTSLDDKSSIQVQLRYISDTPVPQNFRDRCKAMARIFYKNSGEDIIESDLYFSEGCYFYVFYREGKPVYSNLMTDVGKNYFENMLKQIFGEKQQ